MNILRPLSPHLPIYKPQLTSTFPISHRISGAFLVTIVLFFYLLYLKMGLICFTYENFYQFLFYSLKLAPISVEIAALAILYHLSNGVRHLSIYPFITRNYIREGLYIYMFLLFLIYVILLSIPVPSEMVDYKFYIIQILGGSCAVYLSIIAGKPYNNIELNLCLFSFCISTIFVGISKDLYSTDLAFLFLFLYAVLIRFLGVPWYLLFILLLLFRVSFLEGWGLFMQISFIYLMNANLLISLCLYGIIMCFLNLVDPILIPKVLFSYSGALAIFFLYRATTGKEHFYTYVIYFLNGMYLCFLFKNKDAALLLIFLNLIFLIFFTTLTYITNRIHDRRDSNFISSYIVNQGKHKFLGVYYGIIALLIRFYNSEQWMNDWANSLVVQVGILEILIFLFFLVGEEKKGKGDSNRIDSKDDAKRAENSNKGKQMEAGSKKEDCPVTKSTFRGIKEWKSRSFFGGKEYSTGIRDPPVKNKSGS